MNFRSAEEKDLSELDNLLMKLVEDEKINYDKYLEHGIINNHYERILKMNCCQIFVCEINNRVVGYIYCEAFHKNKGVIVNLFVEKEYRGLKIGTTLMRLATNWLKEREVKIIEVNVLANNTSAKKLYNSFGFDDFKETLRVEV